MKTKPAYLVIDTHRHGAPAIVRVTQRWPTLFGGEIAVRLSLEVPDEVMPSVTYWTTIGDPTAIIVSAEPIPVEPPSPDDSDDSDDDEVAA